MRFTALTDILPLECDVSLLGDQPGARALQGFGGLEVEDAIVHLITRTGVRARHQRTADKFIFVIGAESAAHQKAARVAGQPRQVFDATAATDLATQDVGCGWGERPFIAAVALGSLAKTSLVGSSACIFGSKRTLAMTSRVGFICVHFRAEKERSQ